jgi:hypothetical protein
MCDGKVGSDQEMMEKLTSSVELGGWWMMCVLARLSPAGSS